MTNEEGRRNMISYILKSSFFNLQSSIQTIINPEIPFTSMYTKIFQIARFGRTKGLQQRRTPMSDVFHTNALRQE